MRPTAPSLDASLVVVAMARDLEVRLAGLLAGDQHHSLAELRQPLADMIAAVEAQAQGRGAASAIPIGAMVARLAAAVRELGEAGREAELTLPDRGAAWRLGAELVRVARELPLLLKAET